MLMVQSRRAASSSNRIGIGSSSRTSTRSSYHLLTLNLVRCLSPDIAVVDGKWELTKVVDTANRAVPKREGQATLVLKRTNKWSIEAYRYTVK